MLTSSIKGYLKILDKVAQGLTPRNREGKSTAVLRPWKRILGPSTWFKGGKDRSMGEKQSSSSESSTKSKKRVDTRVTEGVMFIPTTPGGILKRNLQEVDAMAGMKNKFKYVESAGRSILSRLFRKDSWRLPCGRYDCLLCPSEPGRCAQKREHLPYIKGKLLEPPMKGD